MPTPSIAIIIPVRNGAPTIARAVRSVLAQTYPSVEIVAVANGCTDSTTDILASFGPAVRTVTLPCGDLSAARRAGLAATEAPLVLFLDADDTLHPEALAEAAEVMARESADVVQLHLLQTFRLRTGLAICRRFPCRYRCDIPLEGAIGAVSEFHPGMIAKLFRRDFLTPLPDTGFTGFWGEDRIYSLILYGRRPDARIAYAPGSRYLYTYGGGSVTPEAPRADDAFRAAYAVMDKQLDPLGLSHMRPRLREWEARLLADRRRAAQPSLRRSLRHIILRLLAP